MTTRALIVAIVAGLAIAGCAVSPPRMMATSPKKLDCNGSQNCDVAVSVDTSTDPARVSVDFDLVLLRKNLGQDKVTWQLPQSGDFVFASNGIVISSIAFRCQSEGQYKFACFYLDNKVDAFKYNINVNSRSGGRVDPLDPWVVTN